MDKVNIDDMIAKNLEKVNKETCKTGDFRPKVTQNATASLKRLSRLRREKEKVAEKLRRKRS